LAPIDSTCSISDFFICYPDLSIVAAWAALWSIYGVIGKWVAAVPARQLPLTPRPLSHFTTVCCRGSQFQHQPASLSVGALGGSLDYVSTLEKRLTPLTIITKHKGSIYRNEPSVEHF